jgi:hypothetical protein
MFTINSIKINHGNTINYDYSVTNDIKKYFNLTDIFFAQYDSNISNVPNSILVIPLLSNVAPISWFAGFDIFVDELDEDFYNCLCNIKIEFAKMNSEISIELSKIHVKKLVKNKIENGQSAMLFSGGVDAYATYFRNSNRKLDLVTIHGADVDLDDLKQWNTLVNINENEKLISDNKKHYIKSNLRTFYTYHVDLLLKDLGWWGRVQHGLALNCLLAPLSIKFKYSKIYIASSYTDNVNISWGSTPEIDNSITWAGTEIIHDGYELMRQEKVTLIVKSVLDNCKTLNLRVCYSELNNGINCSKCEKCCRTIIGIILSNDNPNNYGFETSAKVYDEVKKLFSKGFPSKGVQYFWWEINEKIKENKLFFSFSDRLSETLSIQSLSEFIDENNTSEYKNKSKSYMIRYKLQNAYPKLFKFYLKLRR